jgi:ribosomal protein S18 acetylase RimI-like enzyme
VNPGIWIQQFSEMVSTNNFSPEDSMGCFIDKKLIGFIICGIRIYKHEKHGYIIKTDVSAHYQNKGIESELLVKQIELMKEKGVRHFSLEVPEVNTTAINQYKSVGFEMICKLEC